jgi:hypothetical protein
MTMNRVMAGLAKLTRRGDVEKLLQLNEVRQNPALAADRDYQRKFNGYYRMGRKSAEFYRIFFSMLRALASCAPPPSLADILQKLYDDTGERHLSFASKMRATVIEDTVIFDKNVAKYFRVSSSALPKSNWLARALRRHDQVAEGIQAFIRDFDNAVWPRFDIQFWPHLDVFLIAPRFVL